MKIGGVGASASGSHEHGENEVRRKADTPASKFERLVALAKADEDASGWIEVLDPDNDLNSAGIGALVEVECEIYVPDSIRMLSQGAGELGQFEQLLSAAQAMGLETGSAPSMKDLGAMRSFMEGMGAELVLVGEPDGAEWRIAGRLGNRWLKGEVDGYARVVGKIARKIQPGSKKPLMALPGASLIPRDQRRKIEREGPKPGQEDQWLFGPAAMVDVLAVYR